VNKFKIQRWPQDIEAESLPETVLALRTQVPPGVELVSEMVC
jgi:hypothetical protein